MSLTLLLVIVLVILVVGGLPTWGYHGYGYAPSGLLGTVLVVLLILLLLGYL